MTHTEIIARELDLAPAAVTAAARLLAEGATVPFISRYRKEATGSLDEVQVTAVRDRLEQLAELDKRRTAVLKSLEERRLLTPELRAQVTAAATMAALEDAYLPYRPKRRTRATMAREKGLEPLAAWLLAEAARPAPEASSEDPLVRAAAFVDPAKEVTTAADALAGARDIVAETVSEDAAVRAALRTLYFAQGTVTSRVLTGKADEGAKYRDWFAWEEPVRRVAGHRMLAMRRGEKEKILAMRVVLPDETALRVIEPAYCRNRTAAAAQVREAAGDGWKRLLSVAMETEVRLELKKRADQEAIAVFAANLRQLLLAAPLGPGRVLALDPGFRTGCKLVVLDRQGDLLVHDTVYPHTGGSRVSEAGAAVLRLVKTHDVEAVAIGNGTAGRETERWVRGLGLPAALPVVMVNEAGASVYSASETARSEFPDHDLTVRGAVSIGRRLMDPLAELVKIDPKSIGVGQYQHDVDQRALKRSLDDTVTSCVNAVGVDLNTASAPLLAYVSGLGPQLAANIVAHRSAQGPFPGRAQLLEVPRLGPKAYEQAAGFLRVRGAANPLDASAVHPESYGVVEAMARDLGRPVAALVGDAGATKQLRLERYATDRVGLPTLRDILDELAKPGRDPRARFEIFSFAEGIESLEDVQEGMRLPGIVTNVTAFGAFIDVGVHQDGLAHISQLADRFVRDPGEVVKVGQQVTARVLEVDRQRRRISLSLKDG
ncbi:MAG: RNA-binding transcriptional accessory protein [Krumholzibacteria bacterium]|nr:RNA-binding transcriptional accessory protein [Candidatus Krumholzibacteria bacterium]